MFSHLSPVLSVVLLATAIYLAVEMYRQIKKIKKGGKNEKLQFHKKWE